MSLRASHARVYLTGFETGDFGKNSPTTAEFTVQTAIVRTGTYAARLNASSGTKTTWSADFTAAVQSKVFVRAYLRIATAPASARTIMCTNTSPGGSHPSLRLNPNRTLSLVNNTTVVGTTATALALDTWYCVEFAISVGGKAAVRINGEQEIDWATVGVSSSYSSFVFGAIDTVAAAMDLYWDDIAIDAESWCGPGQVYALVPTGAGTDTDAGFTPNGAAQKWDCVDEIPVDDDTTYLTVPLSTTATESFTVADVPVSGMVRGLTVRLRAKRSGASNGGIRAFFRLGNRIRISGIVTTTASWTWIETGGFSSNFNTTPQGNWWTTERINEMQLGIQAANSSNGSLVSAVIAEVDVDTRSGALPGYNRLWLDGFESGALAHYATVSGSVATSTVQARTGTYSLRVNPAGNTASYIATGLYTGNPELYLRVYVYVASRPTAGNSMRLLQVGNIGVMAAVRMNDAGQLRLEDGTGLLGTGYSSQAIPLNTWTRLEFYARISSNSSTSDGRAELRLDGTTIASTTSLRSASANINITVGTTLAPGSGGCDVFFDDLAVDTTSWVEESRITDLVPAGLGSLTNSAATANGAATQQDCLDDVPPDDDTTYVHDGNSTSWQSYTLPDLPGNAASVCGIAIFTRERRDTGNTTLHYVTVVADGMTGGGSSTVLGDTYVTRLVPYPVSERSSAWTVAMVNGSELAIRTSNTTSPARTTALRLIVEYTELVVTTKTASLTADGYVTEQRVQECIANGCVTATQERSVSGSALLQAIEEREVVADAYLHIQGFVEIPASGVVLGVSVVEVQPGGAVQARIDAEVSASGSLVSTNIQELVADAQASVTRVYELNAGAVTWAAGTAECLASSCVLASVPSTLVADAYLVQDQGEEVAASGVVTAAIMQGLLASGVLIRYDIPIICDASAIVISPFANFRQLTGDAMIITGEITGVSCLATAYVLARTEILASGIVVEGAGAGSLVVTAAAVTSGMAALAAAERTDGSLFVPLTTTVPYSWINTLSGSVTAVAIAVDLGTGSAGGNIQVHLEELSGGTWTNRGTVWLLYDTWQAFRRADNAHVPGWFALPLPVPVPLSQNSWRVAITGTATAPAVLATPAWTGGGGGRIVNAIVISDQLQAYDGRRVFVMSQASASLSPANLIVDMTTAISQLQCGPGSSIQLASSTAIDLVIHQLLHIQSGATLVMTPVPGEQHRVVLSPAAEIVLAGAWQATGIAKTRFARLASPAAMGAVTLFLDQTPSGWDPGDEILLPGGQYVTVAAVGTSSVTLAQGISQALPAGSVIAMASRSVEVTGSSSARLRWQPGSTVQWSAMRAKQVELIGIPGPGSSFSDTVIDRSSHPGRLDETVSVNNLALLGCQQPLQWHGGPGVLDGTTLIIDTIAGGLAVGEGNLTFSCLAQNAGLAPVIVQGGLSSSVRLSSAMMVDASPGSAMVRVPPGHQHGQVIIEGGTLSSQDPADPGSLICVDTGAFLGEARITSVISDGPAARLGNAAAGLGYGDIEQSTFSGPSLVRLDGHGMAHVIRLVNRDGICAALLDDYAGTSPGGLAYGSLIAHRDGTVTREGSHQKDGTIAHSGLASMRIQAASDYRVILGIMTGIPGAAITIQCWARGQGMLAITCGNGESTLALTTSWQEITVSGVIPPSGVTAVVAIVTAGTTCWLDDLVRIV